MPKNIIIDNGSYHIKYGDASGEKPVHAQNCVIRTNDRRVLLGEALDPGTKIINDYSGIHFRRPIEHGQLTQWSVEKQIWDNSFAEEYFTDDWLKDSNLIYCETPFTLTLFQNLTDEVLFEEYDISNLYRCSSGSLMPWLSQNNAQYNDFQLVIDSGFDSTWVIPMIYGLPYWKGVRKMPIAGRFLNSYLREIISFRHYDVTDEMVLVNNIKEKACYVTSDYEASLKKVEKQRKNRNLNDAGEISINYVLPDYKTTNIGYTVTDDKLAKMQKQDTVQSLKLYDERFAIPELLFHPELSGVHKAGIITTIKDSLKHVPALIRPLLTANMVVIGGTFNLSGFKERLAQELKKEIPIDDEIIIHDFDQSKDLSEIGWYAGKQLFAKNGFEKVCVSREEYQELGAEYTQEKFGYKLP
ncbi:hypothetical protein FOA43_003649 [Brettanomyces nanus]|uniref:Actin-like protein ARP6 n=1 Tax=Eeniella nana TaxID=13502 RepID=A0A875S5Q9_EENNA|nr:uncharacterized protein FOA43_003649 [Brettanomyces nanus]QPG76263.1 hypothetical protein FOA43_003649 [Brettanomyces nanus]